MLDDFLFRAFLGGVVSRDRSTRVLCRLASLTSISETHSHTPALLGSRSSSSFGSQYNARSVRDLGIDGSRTSDAETNGPSRPMHYLVYSRTQHWQ